ncbi:MAG: glycosyltransferase family 2 protein [Alphaproteobacteria bacterium]|nr:glycosyltransferase family 2 protein [Alphaproteobacteria bacterium]
MDTTIIVPTYRRAALLERCLDSLRAQKNRHGRTEIIVVDNDPAGSARPVCDRFFKVFAAMDVAFYCTVEPATGVSHARNRGIALANHDILCFIDDDERAAEGWLERLTAPFRDHGDAVAMVGGEVDPDFGESVRPDWLADDILHMLSCHWGWDTQPRFLKAQEWFGEGNCAIRKAILPTAPFRADLGRSGDDLTGSEGVLFLELRAGGHAAYYAPDARVSHHIHPERLSRSWILRRMYHAGHSDVVAHRDSKVLGHTIPSVRINLAALAGLDLDAMPHDEFRMLAGTVYNIGYCLGKF